MTKIVQIAVTSGGEENETDIIYALCDDGSVWYLIDAVGRDTGNEWHLLPNIPQQDEL